jgi:hypothetical protein
MTVGVCLQRGEESTTVASAVSTQSIVQANPKWYLQVRYFVPDAHPILSKVLALVKIA